MSRDYDVIIIGSGPAGFSCAMQSSKFDKRALVVEAHEKYLGGTWINTGTVPSKALREAAKTISDFNSQFGGEQPRKPYEQFRMRDLLQYKDEILEKENRKIKNDLIKNKVDVARGTGKLVDPHTVEVQTHIGSIQEYTADYILICTGSRPVEASRFEVDHSRVLDYTSLLKLTHIPRRLAIVGGGVNALEYATTFSALGSRVSILSQKSEVLSFLDGEIREHFLNALRRRNINLQTSVEVEEISFNSLQNYTEVSFRDAESENGPLKVIETEHVLFMGGRRPNTAGLGLEQVGVETDGKGFITTDSSFQTSLEDVYAAGDVIGFPQLASASFTQGRLAACNMFGIPMQDIPERIPYGLYTIPEISYIGLTEEEAEKKGLDITVGRAYFSNVAKADMTGHEEGLLKLVFLKDSLKLLGVHIMGNEATNLIHIGQAVMAFDGDIRYFTQHVMNYPTLGEAYRTAAFNGFNRAYKAGVKYRSLLEDKEEEG